MPFKNFSDFTYIPGQNLLPSDYLVGYREFNSELRTQIKDLTLIILDNLDLKTSPEILYVNTVGDDTNSGRSEFNALRTIKRACAKALAISRDNLSDEALAAEQRINQLTNGAYNGWGLGSKQVNIFIRTGDYIEDNPIYIPPGVTLIGDNLRSVTVIPKNRFFDIMWINHRCYVWGMTFRKHLKPSYSVAYPEFYKVGGLIQDLQEDRLSFVDNINNSYEPEDVCRLYSIDERIEEAKRFAEERYYEGESLFINPYPVTKELAVRVENLSEDEGTEVFDPWKIAFLNRYFLDIEEGRQLYTDDELAVDTQFVDTEFYENEVRRPYVLTSPYPQGNSSITRATADGANDAGGGILVDGYKVDGPLRSMVMDSFTQFNEGGKGIHIKNNGYAQLVSTFTICCTEGVICESGGTCSINTSNCSFGLSGLVAKGRSPKPTLIGKLAEDIDELTNIIRVDNLGFDRDNHDIGFENDYQPYPGQVFEFVFNTSTQEVTANNGSAMFTSISCTPVVQDGANYACDIILDQNYSPATDEGLREIGVTKIPKGATVNFYIRSTVTASAHTLEYIGTGTVLLSAVPQKGGQTDVTTEAVFDDIGRVFFTSTNQFGDFRIGQDLTIVQATGTIEGETFQRSILTTITPFTIAMAAVL